MAEQNQSCTPHAHTSSGVLESRTHNITASSMVDILAGRKSWQYRAEVYRRLTEVYRRVASASTYLQQMRRYANCSTVRLLVGSSASPRSPLAPRTVFISPGVSLAASALTAACGVEPVTTGKNEDRFVITLDSCSSALCQPVPNRHQLFRM